MESLPKAKKFRGSYRKYNYDPNCPVPRTTQWRTKKSAMHVPSHEDNSDANSSLSDVEPSDACELSDNEQIFSGLSDNEQIFSGLSDVD